MHHKSDKFFEKRQLNPEQLDLVETLGKNDRLRHRRRFTAAVLILTVGLSLGFWLYRYLQSSFPQINISFNLNRPSTLGNDFIPGYSSNWSVYIKLGDSHWSNNFNQNPDSLISQLGKAPLVSAGPIKDTLPTGVEIKEITEVISPQLLFAAYQISIPQKQIIILLRLPQSEKALIPGFVEKIYWHLVSLP